MSLTSSLHFTLSLYLVVITFNEGAQLATAVFSGALIN